MDVHVTVRQGKVVTKIANNTYAQFYSIAWPAFHVLLTDA